MIVKNMPKDVIVYISMNEVSREIIIDFSLKEIRVKNLEGLRKKGKIFIKRGKLDVFEGIEYDPSLYDYFTPRCKECNLENITNKHDCTFITTLLETFIEVERKRINRE